MAMLTSLCGQCGLKALTGGSHTSIGGFATYLKGLCNFVIIYTMINDLDMFQSKSHRNVKSLILYIYSDWCTWMSVSVLIYAYFT